jgi:septal ring factor EnvC (AmiA/AmiB activator)
MPVINTEIEFEAFCDDCGTGICNNVRISHKRNMPQAMISHCDKCYGKLENEIKENEDLISNLRDEIKDLEDKINELEDKINELEEVKH